nr:hypothetical protein DA06_15075 [Georgenia sp. SUBG003]
MLTPYGLSGARRLDSCIGSEVGPYTEELEAYTNRGDGGLRGGLEEPVGGQHVAVDVRRELRAPGPGHPRLRGEVDDGVDTLEEGAEVGGDQVVVDEREGRVRRGRAQVPPLDLGVVGVGEGVDAAHRPALAQQPFRDVAPDEPGGAGEQDTDHE